MRRAVANLLAHIAVLDPEQNLRSFEMAQEVSIALRHLHLASQI